MAATTKSPKKAAYVVLADSLAYPPNRRANRGDVVDDLPGEAITDLVALGDVALASSVDLDDLPPSSTPVPEDHFIRTMEAPAALSEES